MRVERSGGPPDMQAAFQHLIRDRLKGRCLDDQQDAEAAEGRFPDFACFRDLLLIEMKHLESDQSDRINGVFDTKIDPAERPMFFATRDAQHIFDRVSNADELKAAIASKLSRTIERVLSSANKQFASYRSRHPRKNSVSICVILNSSLREFNPDLINHAIYRKSRKGDEARFPAIDAVLYISEKHFKSLPDGRLAFPMLVYESPETEGTWKQLIVARVMEEWSRMRNGGSMVWGDSPTDFDLIEDIPARMSRSDFWYLEYRRRPYLQTVPLNRLRVLYNRCVALGCLTFVKGSWPKPSHDFTADQMRSFTHFIEETNRRGVDLRDLSPDKLTADERAEVYAGLPAELVTILRNREGGRADRDPTMNRGN